MAVTSGFFNSFNHDRRYFALEMSSIFDGLIRDGIFMSIGERLTVTATTNDMMIRVGSGRAWFDHTWTLNDSFLPLELPLAELILNRIDAVVLETNNERDVRKNSIKIVKGTPSQKPVRPTMIKTRTVKQYPLAFVSVKAGVTSIRQADITNMVGSGEAPYVSGILETINIEEMVAQWEDQWTIWLQQKDNHFDEMDQAHAEQIQNWADEFRDFINDSENSFTNLVGTKTAEFTGMVETKSNEFNQTVSTKTTEFNTLVADTTKEITDLSKTTKTDLNKTANDAKKTITNTANTATSNIETKVSEATTTINNLVDTKTTEFNTMFEERTTQFDDMMKQEDEEFTAWVTERYQQMMDLQNSYQITWAEWFANYTSESEEAVNTLLANIQGMLEGDVAANLAQEIVALQNRTTNLEWAKHELAKDHTVSEELQDSNGETILDSAGRPILGRTIFWTKADILPVPGQPVVGLPDGVFPSDEEEYFACLDKVLSGANQRNCVYRGKNLGRRATEEQKQGIKDGTFKGLFLGDYWQYDIPSTGLGTHLYGEATIAEFHDMYNADPVNYWNCITIFFNENRDGPGHNIPFWTKSKGQTMGDLRNSDLRYYLIDRFPYYEVVIENGGSDPSGNPILGIGLTLGKRIRNVSVTPFHGVWLSASESSIFIPEMRELNPSFPLPSNRPWPNGGFGTHTWPLMLLNGDNVLRRYVISKNTGSYILWTNTVWADLSYWNSNNSDAVNNGTSVFICQMNCVEPIYPIHSQASDNPYGHLSPACYARVL